MKGGSIVRNNAVETALDQEASSGPAVAFQDVSVSMGGVRVLEAVNATVPVFRVP